MYLLSLSFQFVHQQLIILATNFKTIGQFPLRHVGRFVQCYVLLCYDLIEKFIPGNLTSTVLDSINNNGLFIFLVSNLLTGFINMSINTLETSNKMAVIILIGYSLTWTLLALYLDKRKIYIKL